jgi:hypothetical protein
VGNSILVESWENLSIWRKSTLAIFLVMWLALSSGVITATAGNIIITTVSLCLLWLGFVSIAFVVTKINEGY